MDKVEVFDMDFVRKGILLALFACIACGNVAQAVEDSKSDKPEYSAAKIVHFLHGGFATTKNICSKFSLKSRKAKIIACAVAASLVVGATCFYIDCRYDNKIRKAWFFLKDPTRAKNLRAFQKR